jgi:hypothetical protein
MDTTKLLEILAFVVIVATITVPVGRWMQRKGRDFEKGPKMPPADRHEEGRRAGMRRRLSGTRPPF